MTTGSRTAASLTISVPHRGQRSGSTSQTRLISSRHVADATSRRAGVVNVSRKETAHLFNKLAAEKNAKVFTVGTAGTPDTDWPAPPCPASWLIGAIQ